MKHDSRSRTAGLAKLVAWVALAAGTALAQVAQASTLSTAPDAGSTMLYGGSQLVTGSAATVTPLQLSGAGTLSFTLVDMTFPATFASLQISVNNGSKSLGSWSGAGTVSLDIGGPMTLYADVFATAQGAAMVGLYNLQVSFSPATTPVPLPASGGLLGAVLGLGALFRRQFVRRTYGCHTPYGVMVACTAPPGY